METINFTKARDNLTSVLDGVTENASYMIITRRKKPDTVIMSLDYFNSMMETMHLLSTPANVSHLSESIHQHKQGLTKNHKLIDG